jgi:hypothetical protein
MFKKLLLVQWGKIEFEGRGAKQQVAARINVDKQMLISVSYWMTVTFFLFLFCLH